MSEGQPADGSAAGGGVARGVTGGGALFDSGGDYAAFRPDYPAELSGRLAAAAPGRGLAVDVGCGTGQLTARMAEHFELTVGLDPATAQVRHGAGAARYVTATAEKLPLRDSCADLITVAQAAPAIPQSNTKMKSGSRIMFSTAPPARMNIDFFG